MPTASEYVYSPTGDPKLFAVHKRGQEPPVLNVQDLTVLRRMTRPAWYKRLAILRKNDAESKDTAYRREILRHFGQLSAPIPGFIAAHGKRHVEFLRVLFVQEEPQWFVSNLATLLAHVGDRLTSVASSVTVQLSSEAFLLIQKLLEEQGHESSAILRVTDADIDIDWLRQLVKQGEVTELPAGLLQLGEPKDPTIRIQLVKDPKRR